MPSPYDYSLNIPDPGQTLLQGIQGGFNMGSAINAQRAAQQKAEIVQQQQKQFNDAFNALDMKTASPEDWARVVGFAPPGQRESLLKTWESLDKSQQQTRLEDASQLMSAFDNNPTLAVQILNQRGEAARNSGNAQEAAAYDALSRTAEIDPEGVQKLVTSQVAMLPGGDKVIDAYNKAKQGKREEELQPVKLKEAKAKATQEQVAARYADEKTQAELSAKGWDAKKIESDILSSKENVKLRKMEADLKRETNELKKDELQQKLDEAKRVQQEKIQERAYEAESAVNSLDTALQIYNEIKSDEDTLRAAVGTSAWRSAVPGSKARTMAGKIEQLQNLIASANLDKLKGAMSDKDILFLKNIESNLDRYQNEDLFIKELDRIAGTFMTAKERIKKRYGISGQPQQEQEQGEQPTAPQTNTILRTRSYGRFAQGR